MFAITWRKALAVPTALTLALGGALLAAAPANALPTPVFTVTTPISASTYTNTGDVVTFTGTNLPTGDTLQVTYTSAGATGTAQTATVTTPVVTGTDWTADATFAGLGKGVTAIDATVTPLAAGVPDATVTAVTRAFALKTAPNPATFTVTAPSSATPVPNDTPTFSGTGTTGVTVDVIYYLAAGATDIAGTGTVDDQGNWSFPTNFSHLQPGVTVIDALVVEVRNGIGLGHNINHRMVFATAPNPGAPALTADPLVTSVPNAAEYGIALDATALDADEPITVTLTAEGKTVPFTSDSPNQTADSSGNFFENASVAPTAPGGVYTATLTGSNSHKVVTATFLLVGTPTLTTPSANQTIVGNTITFAGTGTPGADIIVLYGKQDTSTPTTDDVSPDAKAQMLKSVQAMTKPGSLGRNAVKASSPSAPADPNAPIVVGSNGSWSVTYAATPGVYAAEAFGAIVTNGAIANDSNGFPILSDPSNAVEFTLVAAATTGAGTGNPATLAFTGSSDATPAAIAGGLLLLVGAGLLVISRRRRNAAETLDPTSVSE